MSLYHVNRQKVKQRGEKTADMPRRFPAGKKGLSYGENNKISCTFYRHLLYYIYILDRKRKNFMKSADRLPNFRRRGAAEKRIGEAEHCERRAKSRSGGNSSRSFSGFLFLRRFFGMRPPDTCYRFFFCHGYGFSDLLLRGEQRPVPQRHSDAFRGTGPCFFRLFRNRADCPCFIGSGGKAGCLFGRRTGLAGKGTDVYRKVRRPF